MFAFQALALGAFLVHQCMTFVPGDPSAIPAGELVSGSTHILGSAEAPYTLVEFADYQCPPCAAMAPSLDALVRKHPRSLKLVFRNNPLPMHAYARRAAILAESCPSDELFWQAHDVLYAKKADINDTVLNELERRMSMASSHRDVARERVARDVKDAKRLKLGYTPALFLVLPNGKVRSIRDLSDLDAVL